MSTPPTHHDWINMDWKEAQTAVAALLHHRGYITQYEKSVSNGRVDGLVIKKSSKYINIGILEVKHYKRVSQQICINAIKQGVRYLEANYQSFLDRYKSDNRTIRFFVAVVFTNDFPVMSVEYYINKMKSNFDDNLKKQLVNIFYLPVEQLLYRLKARNLVEPDQQKVDDFF